MGNIKFNRQAAKIMPIRIYLVQPSQVQIAEFDCEIQWLYSLSLYFDYEHGK